MTSIEAYKKFELKVNKLSTNNNVDISPGEFVLIFNEQQTKWYESKFRNSGNRTSDVVQKLVSHDIEILKVNDSFNHTDFALPANYFDYISSFALCSQGICIGRVLYLEERRLQNKNIIYQDSNNDPSFDYQEGFVTLATDQIQIYKTNFTVDKVYLTYYRYPEKIDIQGYINLKGQPSTNIDPELTDHYVDEIIDWCVRQVDTSYDDQENYQLLNDRINKEEI